MNSRISELRKQIRELRTSMLETEAVMREQIMQDEDCSAAGEALLQMRAAMGVLARERALLGDREPLFVTGTFIPRRAPMLYKHPVKHHLPRDVRPLDLAREVRIIGRAAAQEG